jgi:polyphosphate kinase 2 (PPK2 family)
MSKREKRALEELQLELVRLQYWLKDSGKRLLVIFRRARRGRQGRHHQAHHRKLDTRSYRIVALGKPNEVEAKQWYFQRYVPHLPSAGEFVLFDRSWYNRAVVEPAMGFCTEAEYKAFLDAVPGVREAAHRRRHHPAQVLAGGGPGRTGGAFRRSVPKIRSSAGSCHPWISPRDRNTSRSASCATP